MFATKAFRYVDVRGTVRICVEHSDGSIVDVVDVNTSATKIKDIDGKIKYVLQNGKSRMFADFAKCV